MPDTMPYGADTIVIPFTIVPDQAGRDLTSGQDSPVAPTGAEPAASPAGAAPRNQGRAEPAE